MLRKSLIFTLKFLAVFLLILFFIIVYSYQPALSEMEMPGQDIVHYKSANDPVEAMFVPTTLKVVTYNIGYASGKTNNTTERLLKDEYIENLDHMVDVLKGINADVLGLQEVDFSASRSYHINQMEYIAKGLGMPYAAYVITWNKNYVPWPYWPPQAHFASMVSGQAVLSRYPIVSQEVFKFEKPKNNPFWYNWFYMDRFVQKLVIELGPSHIFVWNVHLEAFSQKDRLEQTQLLAQWVDKEKPEKQIVLGDFNSVSVYKEDLDEEKKQEFERKKESLSLFINNTGFKNAEGNTKLFTFKSWDPIEKIDHVLFSPPLKLITVGTASLEASDHIPVWAEFEL